MISLEDRQTIAAKVGEAHRKGARLRAACEVTGIDTRTLQRWKAGAGLQHGDARPRAVRPEPAHALSAAERERILRVANEPRFAVLPPARIVPMCRWARHTRNWQPIAAVTLNPERESAVRAAARSHEKRLRMHIEGLQ